MFGRGSTDDKGPVLCTLHALEAYRELKKDIPINIKVPSCHMRSLLDGHLACTVTV